MATRQAKDGENKLSARKVETAKEGRYLDGGGLYLIVGSTAARRWEFRFRWTDAGKSGPGRIRQMGLGSWPAVSVEEARRRAREARRAVAEGRDPLTAKAAPAASATLFGPFADRLVSEIEGGFRNAKHRAQWRSTLATYCQPIAAKPIDAISTEDVLTCLRPIWQSKAETASRVRGRIEKVLDAAKAKGLRSGENPARWRGHLDALLPKRHKLARGHHAAMAYADVPAFVSRLEASPSTSALAIEFVILTAARTGEVRGMVWGEVDIEGRVWSVPAARMKAGREHRVPLAPRAIAILEQMKEFAGGDDPTPTTYVFRGAKAGKPLSIMALDMHLRRLKVDVTMHGFRSSFRDWCGEETTFPRELAEAALAHTVGDAVERAYRRGDALERRRVLMDAWATYVKRAGADEIRRAERA